ncbi:two-component hybrid sensor and regulator [Calothrix sp. NIES-4071]|nr:two-component hybrid sensor and regulator [Calothrix sp. NIES-4071]BAZ60581.1 two-component hybrid sensor and regulator [Calothrix sp. NIES-4105]
MIVEKQLIIKQEILLHRIANRVRQSLELKEILNAMVGEMRAYLGTDRVKIYQFNSDGSGVVIAESLASDRLPSLMGLHFPADDIPLYARELFVKARQRTVVDLTKHEIGISPLNSLQGENSDQDIRYRPVDPCHVEYLKAMGVKSSVVVPIVLESEQTGKYQPPSLLGQAQLWGLLVSHHSEPRSVTEEELQLIQAVVDQVCIAISHSILLNQVREQAHQEANINNLTKILYTSPTVKLQPAVEEAVKTFNGSGGRLYLLASDNQPVEIYTCGIQPESIDTEESRVVEENRLWQKYLHSAAETLADQTGYKPWSVEWMRSMYHITSYDAEHVNSKLWAIDDLYREPLFRTLAPFFESSRIRSLLIIPLQYGDSILGCLTIFRSEVDTEINWAGYHNPDTRQLMPRQSFEVWRQIKTNQAQVWTPSEIRYATALSERFATAVTQYRLYQQVQALNTNLELQVQERTNNLKLAQTQLIQSEKMSSLGQLVAGIAHEINNPINFIYGNVTHINHYTQTVLNLLKKYQINCPQLTNSLEEEIEQADIEYIIEDLPRLCQSLKVGAERISQLVTSLRTFSRFDQAEIKKVDIHEGIESAVSLLQHRLEPSGTGASIEIIRNYSVLPLVECFAGQLNQVFMNLLLNAIDELQVCSQNSKQIVITTSIIENNLIKITFSDNGRGIKTCYQNKIFDPFFTTKPVGSGIGLGLSISYQIIEQHRGKLYCISQPNQGSSFVIEIPMQLSCQSNLKERTFL